MPKFAGIRGQSAANRLNTPGGRGLILPSGGMPGPLPPADWNELQTEAQNDATNLQSIGNFIQNLLSIQSAILSPLDTVTALLQKDL